MIKKSIVYVENDEYELVPRVIRANDNALSITLPMPHSYALAYNDTTARMSDFEVERFCTMALCRHMFYNRNDLFLTNHAIHHHSYYTKHLKNVNGHWVFCGDLKTYNTLYVHTQLDSYILKNVTHYVDSDKDVERVCVVAIEWELYKRCIMWDFQVRLGKEYCYGEGIC